MATDKEIKNKVDSALWSVIKTFIDPIFSDVWKFFNDNLKLLTEWFFGEFLKTQMEKDHPNLSRVVNSINKKVSDKIQQKPSNELNKAEAGILDEGTTLGDIVSIAGQTLGMLLGGFLSWGSIASARQTQALQQRFRPNIADLSSLIISRLKSPGQKLILTEMMELSGYDDVSIRAVEDALRPMLDTTEIRDLHLRGEISEDDVDIMFEKRGYDALQTKQLKKLFTWLPSVPDLIRLAVREVYTPRIREDFGLDDEFPEQLIEEARKSGASEEVVRNAWAAHWELPSMLRGFEMFHRSVITQEELNNLFVALDIMPFWRDKLTAISYNVITRVDVRRMYRLGVIDEAVVYRKYLDIGYSPEDAELMLQWTIAEETEEERNLTKTNITQAFEKDQIDFDRAVELLREINYGEESAKFILNISNYKKLQTKKKNAFKIIKNKYINGIIPIEKATEEAFALNYKNDEILLEVENWKDEKLSKQPALTIKQLEEHAKNQIISKEEFVTELVRKNYSDKHIEWFVKAHFRE